MRTICSRGLIKTLAKDHSQGSQQVGPYFQTMKVLDTEMLVIRMEFGTEKPICLVLGPFRLDRV